MSQQPFWSLTSSSSFSFFAPDLLFTASKSSTIRMKEKLCSGVRRFSTSFMASKAKGGSSNAWLKRHVSDPYVLKTGRDNYRARSAYKLLEINKSYSLLTRGGTVVECGAAPGAWTQVSRNTIILITPLHLLPARSPPKLLVLRVLWSRVTSWTWSRSRGR